MLVLWQILLKSISHSCITQVDLGTDYTPLFDVRKIPTSLATITHVLIIHGINDIFMFFTHQGRECQ